MRNLGYVSVDKLIEFANNHIDKKIGIYGIVTFPRADVEEVRHGRWKEWNYPNEEHIECSECHAQYYENDLYLGGNEFPKRCPECGAHMDVKENER